MTKPRPLSVRLSERLVRDGRTGCLAWTGVVDRKGYGKIGAGGREGRTLNRPQGRVPVRIGERQRRLARRKAS